MDEVAVFVDQAVLGELPPVCVKDGVPTAERWTIRRDFGAAVPALLAVGLVFIGPLGWIVLAFLGWQRTAAGQLTVTVPLSEPAYQRLIDARRRRRDTGWAAVVLWSALLLSVVTASPLQLPPAIAAIVLAGLVAGAVGVAVSYVAADRGVRQASISISLDASHRWVTLGNVHPDFAAAADEQRRQLRDRHLM